MRLNLLVFTSAVGLAAGQAVVSKETNCWTAMTKDRPQSIDTFTYEQTETDTVYSTTRVQKTTTVTPATSTTTTTKTSIITIKTTAKVQSNTLQVLATVFSTLTVTDVPSTSVTTVTSSTSTTVGYTSTVLPPAGFAPIMDTLPSATLRSSSGAPARKRDVGSASDIESREPEKRRTYPGSGAAAHAAYLVERDSEIAARAKSKSKYPYEVDCYITTFIPETVIVTKTMKAASTITAATPVKVITKMKMIESTQTVVPPDATIYTTSTTTSTIQSRAVFTVTSTTTSTTTNTVNKATATAYPMCGSNNYADSKAMQGFSFNYPVADFNMVQMGQSGGTAYDCCVKCINTPGCLASYLYVPTNTCSIITNGAEATCSVDNVCSATIGWFSSSEVNGIYMNGPALRYTGYWAPP